jgi:hypothetical protein
VGVDIVANDSAIFLWFSNLVFALLQFNPLVLDWSSKSLLVVFSSLTLFSVPQGGGGGNSLFVPVFSPSQQPAHSLGALNIHSRAASSHILHVRHTLPGKNPSHSQNPTLETDTDTQKKAANQKTTK